jgi:hypothetical protein
MQINVETDPVDFPAIMADGLLIATGVVGTCG